MRLHDALGRILPDFTNIAESVAKPNNDNDYFLKMYNEKLEKFNVFFNNFMALKEPCALTDALKDCVRAWCSYMVARDRYDISQKILNCYTTEYGLKDNIEKIKEFISTIEEYPKTDFEAVKSVGYSNYIRVINNYFIKMTDAYTSLENYRNTEYIADNPSTVKGFITIECFDNPILKDVPKAIDLYETAKKEIEKGENKSFISISATYSLLYNHKNDKNGKHLDALIALQQRFEENKEKLNSEPEKAKQLYEKLSGIINDEWCESFNPNSENSEATSVKTSEELIQLYTDKNRELIYFLEEGKK